MECVRSQSHYSIIEPADLSDSLQLQTGCLLQMEQGLVAADKCLVAEILNWITVDTKTLCLDFLTYGIFPRHRSCPKDTSSGIRLRR